MDKHDFESAVACCEFLDGLQEGVWVSDVNGTVVFANRALASLLGYKSSQVLVGRAWRDLFPSAEAARLGREKPDDGSPAISNTVILNRDSRELPVTVELVGKTVEGTTWFLGSVMTASKPTPVATRAETAGRQVMDNAADGICIIEDSKVVYANRRFEEMTGYTTSQIGSLGLDRLVVSRDRGKVAQAISEPSRMLTPVHHEVRIISRSGNELDCELRIVPTESNGHTVLLCFLRDISQLRRAEQARTDFIATVSHELRTPLAAIKEAMSLLSGAAAGQLKDRERRYLEIAMEEINRLNRMIDNLLQVSRMESGKETLRLQPVGLDQVLTTSLESLSLLINKKNLQVDKQIPDKLPPMLVDKDRLLQVFNNLLDNSIKYTPPGSTVRIAAHLMNPDAPVLAGGGVLSNTSYVQVTIGDSGPGIPAEFLDRIFGKFERMDPHGPGIGLGLSIVRSIIEMHHGKVWALSTLGEGTTFNFILPLKEE